MDPSDSYPGTATLARFSWSDGATERINTCEATSFSSGKTAKKPFFLVLWMAWEPERGDKDRIFMIINESLGKR